MPKISEEDLEAIQLRLFKSDLQYLRSLFKGHFGVNKVIRSLIRSFVVQTKAEAAKKIDKMESSEELV